MNLKRRLKSARRAKLAAAVLLFGGSSALLAQAQDGPNGITTPTVFAAFRPDAPSCTTPPGLKRALTFVQDNEREFMQGVRRGLALAAKSRDLEFGVSLSNNDPVKMIGQIEDLRKAQIGAIVVAPVDPPSLGPGLKKTIWSGSYVATVVPPPAITILNAPQYLTGKVLGDAAADYIIKRLGGNAKVVLLTHDSLQFLAPRFTAMRDALRRLPGVTIVADISPVTVNKTGGRDTMRKILLAQPTIDVILGADTVVLGALDALREAGKVRNDQFLGGIDGELEAVAEIKKGGPYKASVSLASSVFGYALGNYSADWLEGKSVPQAIDILPHALAADNIAQYEMDVSDPASVFSDSARRTKYLSMYGNICYDTRANFVNFPWSSERK